jgi:Domain of unknown function (DUF1707)
VETGFHPTGDSCRVWYGDDEDMSRTALNPEADMTDNPTPMRASDRDRQAVVDRLRTGLEDGRLTMEEYVERMGLAYQAKTYADLAPLHADLPAADRAPGSAAPGSAALGPVAPGPAAVAPHAPPAAAGPRCQAAGLPAVLKVLWTIWLAAVSVNVVVWALVSGTHGHLIYPWPLWVAGPYGAVLAAVSVSILVIRSGLRAAAR